MVVESGIHLLIKKMGNMLNIKSYNAGVNKLNLCLTGEVMIEGSFIGNKKGEDDFIRRSVTE